MLRVFPPSIDPSLILFNWSESGYWQNTVTYLKNNAHLVNHVNQLKTYISLLPFPVTLFDQALMLRNRDYLNQLETLFLANQIIPTCSSGYVAQYIIDSMGNEDISYYVSKGYLSLSWPIFDNFTILDYITQVKGNAFGYFLRNHYASTNTSPITATRALPESPIESRNSSSPVSQVSTPITQLRSLVIETPTPQERSRDSNNASPLQALAQELNRYSEDIARLRGEIDAAITSTLASFEHPLPSDAEFAEIKWPPPIILSLQPLQQTAAREDAENSMGEPTHNKDGDIQQIANTMFKVI